MLDYMKSPEMQELVLDPTMDCSELSSKLYEKAGEVGKQLRIRPNESGSQLNILEKQNGKVVTERYDYHAVYQQDGYIYDPRLSSDPIPRGDYVKLLTIQNPSGFKLEEEIFDKLGLRYRGMKP